MANKKIIGFAFTKSVPVKNHPAQFRQKKGSDYIEYITFTHSDRVDLDRWNKDLPLEQHRFIKTEELIKNININERNTGEKSFAVPIVYEGKRTLLGRQVMGFEIFVDDRKKIDSIFKNGKKIKFNKD